MPKPSTIAIDGPVAAGKTAVGRLLAQRLGYRFLDTGTMYRAVTWETLRQRIDPSNGPAIAPLAQSMKVELVYANTDREGVFVDGRDVTGELRRPEVERAVSLVAQVAEVRQALVAQQQVIARGGNLVMAGRDIGTVVLPHAPLKVFLQASVQERARRRFLELRSLEAEVTYEGVLEDLERRDRLDSQRALSPLTPAPDARIIDTDGIEAEEVVHRILSFMDP